MDRPHWPARFPGMDAVACVCPAEAAVASKGTLDARRADHAKFVSASGPIRAKLHSGAPLTADDMLALRATWNKYMAPYRSPYVPVRAIVDPEWAIRACGTSALCCKAAAEHCPFRGAILAGAAAGHPDLASPPCGPCAVCDGNASLADVGAAHTLAAMAAMVVGDRPFSLTPPRSAGRL
jgi:hypothetical protein